MSDIRKFYIATCVFSSQPISRFPQVAYPVVQRESTSFKNSFICVHSCHCFLVYESHFSSLSFYFSISFMSLFPSSSSVRCQGCNKAFKRLSTHISQNEVCGSHYETIPSQVGHDVTNLQRSDCAYFNNEATSAAAQRHTRKYSRFPTGEERHVVDLLMHDDDNDDFQVFDNALPCSQEFDNDSNSEDAPDGIILELYKEMPYSQTWLRLGYCPQHLRVTYPQHSPQMCWGFCRLDQ
jgi:hypothetical protein